MYEGGTPPQVGYPDPKEVEWVFGGDRLSGNQRAMFIKGGASAEDCVQGDLGDCWLMSALSVAANKDELIIGGVPGLDYSPDMIVDKELAHACS